ELRDRDLDIGADLARLDEDLAEVPASADLEVFVERVRGRGLSPLTGKPAVDILVHGDRVDPVVGDYLREKGYNDRDIMAVGVQQLGGNDLNTWLSMTEADKRNLVRSMLDGKVKGKRAGVYVRVLPRVEGRRSRPFTYKVLGRLQFGSLTCFWSKARPGTSRRASSRGSGPASAPSWG